MTSVYFTDRDLAKQFPAILTAAGLDVRRHDEHFAPDAADEEWLKFVGERGWIAVTHDKRIRYKPNQLEAVAVNRVALLVVVGQAPFRDLAASFVAMRDRIEGFIADHHPPYIAKVYRASPEALARNPYASGRIELWHAP